MGSKQPNEYDFSRTNEKRQLSLVRIRPHSPITLLTTSEVVALSADCQDSTKRLCLNAGMNDFFSKPLKKGMKQVLVFD